MTIYRRCDPPCQLCFNNQPCRPDGQLCERFVKWQKIQDAKAAVRNPSVFDETAGEAEWHARDKADVEGDAQTKELLSLIDERLDLELRADWLRLRAGVAVQKQRRLRVEEAVREILGDTIDGLPACA